MAGMTEHFLKWLKMPGNGWHYLKWLEIALIAGNGCNDWNNCNWL